LNLCWGECPKNRVVRTPEGEPGLNYLCPGLKRFYGYIAKDIAEIRRRVTLHTQEFSGLSSGHFESNASQTI
jgi:uncharacterized protein